MIASHHGLLRVAWVLLENIIFVTPATSLSPVGNLIPLLAWCCFTFPTVCFPLLQSQFGFLWYSCTGPLLLSALPCLPSLCQSYLTWCHLCCWHINSIADFPCCLCLKAFKSVGSCSDNLPFLESLTVLFCINLSYKTHYFCVQQSYELLCECSLVVLLHYICQYFSKGSCSWVLLFPIEYFHFCFSLSVISRELTVYISLCGASCYIYIKI